MAEQVPDIRELFLNFLQSRDRESFLAIRAAVVASDPYAPYSSEMRSMESMIAAESFEAAGEEFSSSMPNLLLSPSAHLALSVIAEKRDDEKGAELERMIAVVCCEGILSTGDGTRQCPYVVLRTSDEYDVLQFLGKSLSSQSLIHDSDRHFDVMCCQDGSELWFDITDQIGQLEKKFGGETGE